MTSYGKIYCPSASGDKVTSYFANILGDNGKKDLVHKTYNKGILMFRKLQGREPTQFEQDSTYRAAEEYVNRLMEQPKVRSIRHLIEITHPLLSIDNTLSITKKISQSLKDDALCCVANHDESIFQLCIIRNGRPLTVHQTGDELQHTHMTEKCGDVGIVASFFEIPSATASEFIQIRSPIDAEHLFFDVIVPMI